MGLTGQGRTAARGPRSRGGRPPGGAPPGAPPAAPPRRPDAPVKRRQPPRDVVRTAECPTCSAPAGQPCQGRRGDRRSHHLARVELATELRGRKRLQPARTGAETRPASTPSPP